MYEEYEEINTLIKMIDWTKFINQNVFGTYILGNDEIYKQLVINLTLINNSKREE